jgi:gliding motility-associated-like protein
MLNRNYLFLLQVVLFLCPLNSFSQYILNGDAVQEKCNCYLLTSAQTWKGGSVWQQNKIDLNNPFDFKFDVYLGDIDAGGADGMVFMLQPLSTNLGTQGEGMGFQGVSPSIGISLDTWQNLNENDPVYDHISIQADGVIKHGNDLAGPIPASSVSDNIEDGRWHILQIKWDPSTDSLTTYFDGVFRLATKTNLIKDIFNDDPMVYWGFSAATGGAYNVQKFCTALDPIYNTNSKIDAICEGAPMIFRDSSVSFTKIKSYYWDFGDGTVSNLADPPPHSYTAGTYKVSHSIVALDGCTSDTLIKTIRIGDYPQISIHAFDTCEQASPKIKIDSKLIVGTINEWQWSINGNNFSNAAAPDFTTLPAGNYAVALTAASDIGCPSNSSSSNFILKPKPVIDAVAENGCINVPVIFDGLQKDQSSITKWHWDFGDKIFAEGKNVQNIYNEEGNYSITLTADASNGCSTTISKNININAAHANAGNDTIVARNTLFQLHGSGGVSYSWSPAAGLSDPNISDPIIKITNDTRFFLTVKNLEGCVDTASMKATVFNGSAIYVPTAFTPNHDGLNDILKPFYVGIKTLYYFTIYNRWGEKVFSTTDMNQGWDGSWKQTVDNGSAYVWVLKAVDMLGKMYNLKGSFILLK